MKKYFCLFLILLGTIGALFGCDVQSESPFFGAVDLNKGSILIANANGTTSYTVTQYSITGNFEKVVFDSTNLGLIPRGLALYDAFSVLLAVDGIDSIQHINRFNFSSSVFYSGALLAGNIFQMARTGDSTFVIEGNNVERFNSGARYPAAGNAYVPTTVGGCTIATGRGLHINKDGHLLVTSTANNTVNIYDVSSPVVSCLASDASFGANQPVPVLGHSNGNLYFGTLTNDSIYMAPDDLSVAPVLFSSGADINNPTALAELPDGTILVASDGIDVIVQIDATTGLTLNGSFINNGFTQAVSQILVIPPQ